jgi:hypothetical protein
MNVGKTFKSCKNSGFVTSGEVQSLMYSSSISWGPYGGVERGLKISSNSCGGVLGLGESSMVSEREVDRGIVLEWGEDE